MEFGFAPSGNRSRNTTEGVRCCQVKKEKQLKLKRRTEPPKGGSPVIDHRYVRQRSLFQPYIGTRKSFID
jgi:hypothetical protein